MMNLDKKKLLFLLSKGDKGDISCKKAKQTILRHCALSYTILLMSISDDKYFKQVFNTGKDLIEKGKVIYQIMNRKIFN